MQKDIHWYPFHMKRSQDEFTRLLKKCQILLEMRDAHLPLSSASPLVETTLSIRDNPVYPPRILVFNKSERLSPSIIGHWRKYFKHHQAQIPCFFISCKSGKGLSALIEHLKKFHLHHSKKHSLVALIVGIPNIGKSSLINCLTGKKKAGVSDKPGYTRRSELLAIRPGLFLLDSPGVLAPKLKQEQAWRLAIFHSISQRSYETISLAYRLLAVLFEHASKNLEQYNKTSFLLAMETYRKQHFEAAAQIYLENIARSRHFITHRTEPDLQRAASMLIQDFREHRLPYLDLDRIIPPE